MRSTLLASLGLVSLSFGSFACGGIVASDPNVDPGGSNATNDAGSHPPPSTSDAGAPLPPPVPDAGACDTHMLNINAKVDGASLGGSYDDTGLSMSYGSDGWTYSAVAPASGIRLAGTDAFVAQSPLAANGYVWFPKASSDARSTWFCAGEGATAIFDTTSFRKVHLDFPAVVELADCNDGTPVDGSVEANLVPGGTITSTIAGASWSATSQGYESDVTNNSQRVDVFLGGADFIQIEQSSGVFARATLAVAHESSGLVYCATSGSIVTSGGSLRFSLSGIRRIGDCSSKVASGSISACQSE